MTLHPRPAARLVPALLLAGLLGTACVSSGQSTDDRRAEEPPARPLTEVPIELVSARVESFETAIEPPGPVARSPRGDDPVRYREALVLTVEVPRRALEALPPSMQPYLYIGDVEITAFDTRLADDENRVRLTFHVPEWRQRLRRGAPMVLTIDHDAPVRDPKRYERRDDLPRWDPAIIGSPDDGRDDTR